MTEVENHTLRLLQELRADFSKRFDELDSRFDDVTQRIDGNAILINMLAGLLSHQDDRITKLENSRPS